MHELWKDEPRSPEDSNPENMCGLDYAAWDNNTVAVCLLADQCYLELTVPCWGMGGSG